MKCDQFRESLDAYMDGELSAEEMSLADAHRQGCPSCGRALSQLLELRHSLKRLASSVEVPPTLEGAVAGAVTRSWPGFTLRPWLRRPAISIAAMTVASLALVASLGEPPVLTRAADALDRLAVGVNDDSAVIIRGTLLCRDCELARQYGITAPCDRIGHHGALFTADGVILNLIEQQTSSRLIHDPSLFGKEVLIRGRLLRGARALTVNSYEVEG